MSKRTWRQQGSISQLDMSSSLSVSPLDLTEQEEKETMMNGAYGR
jgi:predicted transcriptional regulator